MKTVGWIGRSETHHGRRSAGTPLMDFPARLGKNSEKRE
jgi:hypothetical protein